MFQREMDIVWEEPVCGLQCGYDDVSGVSRDELRHFEVTNTHAP